MLLKKIPVYAEGFPAFDPMTYDCENNDSCGPAL
jgi:hypothetical protein